MIDSMTPSRQHRDALFALSVLEASLGILHPAMKADRGLNARCNSVRRWLDRSSQDLRVDKMVSGARRDLEDMCTQLAEYIPESGLSGEELLTRWSALYWTGFTLLLEAQRTCPLYVKGHNWRWLIQTGWALGYALIELSPGCDEVGTDIYLEIG